MGVVEGGEEAALAEELFPLVLVRLTLGRGGRLRGRRARPHGHGLGHVGVGRFNLAEEHLKIWRCAVSQFLFIAHFLIREHKSCFCFSRFCRNWKTAADQNFGLVCSSTHLAHASLAKGFLEPQLTPRDFLEDNRFLSLFGAEILHGRSQVPLGVRQQRSRGRGAARNGLEKRGSVRFRDLVQ